MYVTTSQHTNYDAPTAILARTHQQSDAFLRPNACLYYEGDSVDWMYQVKSGVVCLTRLLKDGRRQVIAFGYPGDIVGFPSDGLHHTDCEALTDARLRPLSRSALESGDSDPELHKALLQAALREISAMQDHFMMLGRKSALEKVASFLQVLESRVGTEVEGERTITLPMSRTDIADFLGLTTETVCRTLTSLRRAGIISIENIHTIIINDPNALVRQTMLERD